MTTKEFLGATSMYKFTLALIISALPLAAQSNHNDDPLYTHDEMNGRHWVQGKMDEIQKAVFLVGYMHGVRYETRLMSLMKDKTARELARTLGDSMMWPNHLSVGEVQSLLDKFYETPENLSISIPKAIFIVAMKTSGQSNSAIEKMINEFRSQSK
jgi:hypothetical protein